MQECGAAVTSSIELSFVIPVYNGSATVGVLLEQIRQTFSDTPHEVVLVNDGSQDDSERTCARLAENSAGTVSFLQLARNFGEHNAVLAGLNQASGNYVAVLDDDGQNPPEEVLRLWTHIRATNCDVVYGRYIEKKHGWFRNLGSWFNNSLATLVLKKPRGVYLASFKILNRFVVNEIIKYRGPFPYIDGLIYRTTHNIGQIDVEHRERVAGRSGYTFRKLVKLWLSMFLGFSMAPLRMAALAGFGTSLLSLVLLLAILAHQLWVTPTNPIGTPTVLVCMALLGGVQLAAVGVIGEYVGRIFLQQSGMPQYVVRYSLKPCARNSLSQSPDGE
jgi:undecaprenyl-phosphate 4-deoxy-4-formamido-L-arabinose transferase